MGKVIGQIGSMASWSEQKKQKSWCPLPIPLLAHCLILVIFFTCFTSVFLSRSDKVKTLNINTYKDLGIVQDVYISLN